MKSNRDIALVIDLEATCWKGTPPNGMKSEIIEIGISAIDYNTKEIRIRDTIIVKPEYSEISNFCTELTTLTKEYVDEHGISFSEACKILETKFKSRDRVFFSWGEYDKNQIKKDCYNKSVRNPFGRTHINIKSLFSFAYGLNRDVGVSKALEFLGMDFDGTAHRGIDDAENISRIIQKIFIPLVDKNNYKERTGKKEHEVLEEYIKSKYSKKQLKENVSRVINKILPENPDKSMR